MSYTIIHIPTKSSSNKIKRFIVVFIPRQLTLGHVVERSRNHVRLIYDLPNGITLVQKIIVSLIFLVTEFLIIKDHKLNSTFLHVVLRSKKTY
jgi:hypothetical protein